MVYAKAGTNNTLIIHKAWLSNPIGKLEMNIWGASLCGFMGTSNISWVASEKNPL